jgi:ATP-dependent Clp protease protease subunit
MNIENKEDDNVLKIGIHDEISSWTENNSKQFYKLLSDNPNKDLEISINSPGGSVHHGFAIYSMLVEHNGKKTINIHNAYSVAALISMASTEKPSISETGFLMIHNAWTPFTVGSAKELRKNAELLDKIDNISGKVFSSVSGLSEEKVKEMMDNTTWLTAEEALEMGFVSKIISKKDKDNKKSEDVYNRFDLSIFNNVPKTVLNLYDKNHKPTEESGLTKIISKVTELLTPRKDETMDILNSKEYKELQENSDKLSKTLAELTSKFDTEKVEMQSKIDALQSKVDAQAAKEQEDLKQAALANTKKIVNKLVSEFKINKSDAELQESIINSLEGKTRDEHIAYLEKQEPKIVSADEHFANSETVEDADMSTDDAKINKIISDAKAAGKTLSYKEAAIQLFASKETN